MPTPREGEVAEVHEAGRARPAEPRRGRIPQAAAVHVALGVNRVPLAEVKPVRAVGLRKNLGAEALPRDGDPRPVREPAAAPKYRAVRREGLPVARDQPRRKRQEPLLVPAVPAVVEVRAAGGIREPLQHAVAEPPSPGPGKQRAREADRSGAEMWSQ